MSLSMLKRHKKISGAELPRASKVTLAIYEFQIGSSIQIDYSLSLISTDSVAVVI